MSQIQFKNRTTALGRNGTSICIGLDVYPSSRINVNNVQFRVVELAPINSYGYTTRCYIEIDMEAIPELIKHLQYFYDETNKPTRDTRLQGQ